MEDELILINESGSQAEQGATPEAESLLMPRAIPANRTSECAGPLFSWLIVDNSATSATEYGQYASPGSDQDLPIMMPLPSPLPP